MGKQRVTIRNYPIQGGLVNTGGQATINEMDFWETENFTSDFDGRLRKRPGVRQWGQTLQGPAPGGLGYTELFNDLSHFNIDDSAAGSGVVMDNDFGALEFNTLAASAGTEDIELRRLPQSADGADDNVNQMSLRFLVQFPGGLPAADGTTEDRGFSVGLRGTDSVVARQLLFLDTGIYVFNSSNVFEIVSGTDIDDSRWHVVEWSTNGTASTISIDGGAAIATPVLGNALHISPASVAAGMVILKSRTNQNGTYTAKMDFLQARSAATDPFVPVPVEDIFDWSSAVPRQQHLLAVAGNTIYKDDGHTGIWRALDFTKTGELTVLVPYQTEMILMHPNLGMRRWGGKLAPEPVKNSPDGRLGTDHLGRLWVTTADMPLRVYFSRTGDITTWTVEGDPDQEFITSGFIDIPDPRGRRITNMMGNYYGSLLIWTETSLWRISGVQISQFFLENISKTVGCVGPRAATRVQNDVIFLSGHGLHSLQTTQEFGDIDEKFLSAGMRNRFQPNSYFNLRQIRPDYRSTVTHAPHYNRTYVGVPISGDSRVDHIFELNHGTGQWTGPWTLPGHAVDFVLLGHPVTPLLFIGDDQGRIGWANDDRRVDWETEGYAATLRSARLDGRSLSTELVRRTIGWIELRLYVMPRADGDITVTWFADGHKREDSDTFALNVYDENIIGDATDTTFVTDSSSEIIDSERVGVISVPIDMRGKWLEFSITQSGTDEDFMLAGYELDFLPKQDDKENA